MINGARRFEHVLDLEQAFTVVYRDQRGCGRPLRKRQHQSRPPPGAKRRNRRACGLLPAGVFK
jgi:hypothetical protein